MTSSLFPERPFEGTLRPRHYFNLYKKYEIFLIFFYFSIICLIKFNIHQFFQITTVNGAMIVPEKQDILIPQGVAQAVDRVMFPLPVGDILQTLQSDRERRFTHFLRALFASGMSDSLQNKGKNSGIIFLNS